MKKIRCPRCRKEATWEGNPFRPFCSERCKLIDLGNWATGRYVISAPLSDSEKLELDDASSGEDKGR